MRLGARNASEIVILILRTLQRSRFAIASWLDVVLVRSSHSQSRPLAIEWSSRARCSARIGRTRSWIGMSGSSNSLRFLDGGFRQGTVRAAVFGASRAPFVRFSVMTSWPDWTSIRARCWSIRSRSLISPSSESILRSASITTVSMLFAGTRLIVPLLSVSPFRSGLEM